MAYCWPICMLQIYNGLLVDQYISLPLNDDILFGQYVLMSTWDNLLVGQYKFASLEGRYIEQTLLSVLGVLIHQCILLSNRGDILVTDRPNIIWF